MITARTFNVYFDREIVGKLTQDDGVDR